MIYYNFYDLMSLHRFIPNSIIHSKYFVSPLYRENFTLDNLWKQIEKAVLDNTDYNLQNILNRLKADTFMAVYTSLHYSTANEIDRATLIAQFLEFDSVYKNIDSRQSAQQSFSHKKTNLKNTYEPGNISVPLSGQNFDNNALLYFKQFWGQDNKIRCFNIQDFLIYIRSSQFWPYNDQNIYGMSFYNYFKGIRNMSESFLDDASIQNPGWETVFSSYILEQLFYPISFIQNIKLHLSVLEKLACNSCFTKEEVSMKLIQSLLLIQPLFKLPSRLFNSVSDDYKAAIGDYIEQPKNIRSEAILKANIQVIYYYSQFLFPLLKILLSNCLYSIYDADLEKLKNDLKAYIETNISEYDYYASFVTNMDEIATMIYPKELGKNIPVDIQGNKALNASNKKIDEEQKGNTIKRNNESIKAYEANFTHNFFGKPEFLNYFDWCNKGFGNNYGNDYNIFTLTATKTYIQQAKDTPSNTLTFNYLYTKARELNVPWPLSQT